MFANKYMNLYGSVPICGNDLVKLKTERIIQLMQLNIVMQLLMCMR